MGIFLNTNPAGGCANIIDESPIIGIDTEMLIEISKKYEGKTKLPKDLCYLEGELRENYLHDMKKSIHKQTS